MIKMMKSFTYEKPEDAEICVEKLTESCLDGQMIFVSLYRTKKEKENRHSLNNKRKTQQTLFECSTTMNIKL